jgi:hypothetical protein
VASRKGKPSFPSEAPGAFDAFYIWQWCAVSDGSDLAFGTYYHHLVARGLPRRAAMMAVMRKMLIVAYRFLKTKETYDPAKVVAQAVVHSPVSEPPPVQRQLTSVGSLTISTASFSTSSILLQRSS